MGCDGVSGEVNNQCLEKMVLGGWPSLLTWSGTEVQWPSFVEKQMRNSALCFAFKISIDFYPLMAGLSVLLPLQTCLSETYILVFK